MNVVTWDTRNKGYDKYTVLIDNKMYAFDNVESEKGYEVDCFDADFVDMPWMEMNYHRVHFEAVPKKVFEAIQAKQEKMAEDKDRELRISTALEFAKKS